MWARHVDRPDLDAASIASVGISFALPLGAVIGRVATPRDRDRLERILLNAFVMVVPCAFVAWTQLDRRNELVHFIATLGGMWAPTTLLVMVLERWTRPPAPIPTCEVHKTLL